MRNSWSIAFLSVSLSLVVVQRVTSFAPSYVLSAPQQFIPQKTPGKRLATTSIFAIPEPGACPECADENSYWDGSTLFVCTACAHEWPVDAAEGDEGEENDDGLSRDVNGNVLESGDTCVLVKDLAKGKLKKGLKVKIRLGDYGDGHDCEASISQLGTYALKSEFLKKV
jgi:protein PhnA